MSEPKTTIDIEVATIPKSYYEELIRAAAWLASLEAAGVDNWDGIDLAYDLFYEDYPEYKEEF